MVCLVLLAICCVLLPKAGESAGGIVSLGQAVEERGMEALYGEESQNEPAKEEELTETQSQTSKEKRATEEDALPGKNKANPLRIDVSSTSSFCLHLVVLSTRVN